MHSKPLIILMLSFFYACNNNAVSSGDKENRNTTAWIDNPYRHITDIPLPGGYTRTETGSNSFTTWLRDLELKKDKTVYLFDGRPKHNQSAQFAVIDLSTGNKDLQQCADAVMRLRAEYLFANKRFVEIVFKDNENKTYRFSQPYTREHFMHFMEQVFGMCGSASLAKQLRPASFSTIAAGDVLIRGGFPGHAVMVMDVAQNNHGKKIYLLAQSYMPAQDIHLLKNPNNENLSPWYEAIDTGNIITPEYFFHAGELKQW